jgi:hypothetical protein
MFHMPRGKKFSTSLQSNTRTPAVEAHIAREERLVNIPKKQTPRRPVIAMNQINRVETVDENSPLRTSNTVNGSDHSSSQESSFDKDMAPSRSRENKSSAIANPASTHMNPLKKVRWNMKGGKIHHIHRKDMNEAERESVWYSKKDDKLTLAMAKVTVRMIMKGESFDDVDNCSRGLEEKTMSECRKRAKNKRRVITAVLMEQELQRLEGVKNPEQLAKASFKHTKDISIKASDKGIEDEHDIQEYLDDARRYRDDLMKFLP